MTGTTGISNFRSINPRIPKPIIKSKSNGITWYDLTDGSILGSHQNVKIFIQKGFSIFYPDQTAKPMKKKENRE